MLNRFKTCLMMFRFVCRGSQTVGWMDRLRIFVRIQRALKRNKGRSASTLGEQLVLVNTILDLPKNTPGAIAEFGCYKGLSSVALSIAAKYSGRKLLVFDSFEGLPEPVETIRHIADDAKLIYKKGDLAGTLEEVRMVVEKYGEIGCVEFVKGYFCDTLPKRPADEKYALVFEDADLVESVRDVLRYAWPRLGEQCYFFSHEALDLEVVKLFYCDKTWKDMHGTSAPGLAGAGLGLPIDEGQWGALKILGLRGSCLAYCFKRRSESGMDAPRR
jgi:O-methyltransferase